MPALASEPPAHSQLLATGAILVASALTAAIAAAKFWEKHTAMQLLGMISSPPVLDENSSTSSAFIQPDAFRFKRAAAEFALGLLAGAIGDLLPILFIESNSPSNQIIRPLCYPLLLNFHTGFAVCMAVLVASSNVAWGGRGSGDATQASAFPIQLRSFFSHLMFLLYARPISCISSGVLHF
jgi:hypothetical protein